MKEVMAIIRMNMINKTKDALVEAGYNSLTAKKVFEEGKKQLTMNLLNRLWQLPMDRLHHLRWLRQYLKGID